VQSTYAITWRGTNGLKHSGRLDLGPLFVRLDGWGAALRLPYAEIARVRMGRSSAERIDGRQTLVVERHGGAALLVAAVGQPGALAELAECLAGLTRTAAAA
jgi:hypothetical protein